MSVAAWLGLVPRQHSSGGKNVLLGISKRGDSYLRTLLIHGARAALWAAPGIDPVGAEPVYAQRLEEIAGIDDPHELKRRLIALAPGARPADIERRLRETLARREIRATLAAIEAAAAEGAQRVEFLGGVPGSIGGGGVS